MPGWMDRLHIDAEDVQNAPERRLKQKWETKTRAQENAEAEKADDAALEKWRIACRRRDRNRCRVCGKKVEVTLKHIPKRAECHHIEPRANKALRHDRRNGLTVHLSCHELLTRRELVIVQDKREMFELENGGRKYWNADAPLECKRPEELTTSEKEQRHAERS